MYWKSHKALITFASLLITLPRIAFAYPFYVIASFFLIDYKSSGEKPRIIFLALCLTLLCSYYILSRQFCLSITAFILELALITPLLLFISGFRIAFDGATCLYAVRIINCVCLISGFYNLTTQGFPLLLPYLDYLPDEYSALFGLGGGRIVTVFGFLGILGELYLYSSGGRSRLWIVVGLCNFLLPSYLVGIASGAVGLVLLGIRGRSTLILALVFSIPVVIYASLRLVQLDTTFYVETGWHPKLYGHLLAFEGLATNFRTALFGTGLGQFSSSAQLWASSIFSPSSPHAVPKLPLLFMSEFHLNAFSHLTGFVDVNRFTFSSAINKPYTGLTTMFAELGLTALVVLFLFAKRVYFLCQDNRYGLSFFTFFILLNLVDQWFDNLWLGYALLLATGLFSQVACSSRTPGASVPT